MLRTSVLTLAAFAFALPLTANADDTGTPALYADFSDGPVTGTLNISETGTDENPYYGGSHRLLANNASSVTASFNLEDKPAQTILRLEHLTASFGSREGYSPVDIIVNNQIAAQDFSPQAMNYVWSTFDISQLVQQGENEIVIRLGNARTHYWIKRMEIATGD